MSPASVIMFPNNVKMTISWNLLDFDTMRTEGWHPLVVTCLGKAQF